MANSESDSVDKGWLYHPTFPSHWERRPLYSMAKWVNGIAFRDVSFSHSGRPVIKIAEIKNGISGQTKYTQQTFDEAVLVRHGDLLFSWSGQPKTSIDAFWWRGPEGWLNQHVFRVTPTEGIDTVFFYYLLRYIKPSFIGIASNKQTTGLGHVTKRDIENIEAAHPIPPEQRAIAHVLGAIDSKIDLNRRANETLEAMARALFHDWFIAFGPTRAKMAGREPYLPIHLWDMFPEFINELGIPAGWEKGLVSDLIDFNPSEPLRKDAVAPYLDMSSLPTVGTWPDEPILRAFGSGMRFRNGDTLLARITPCLENGKTAFIQCLPDGQVGWGSTEYIVMRPKAPVPAGFGYLLARDADFRKHVIQSMTGTSGRQRAQADSVMSYPISKPSDDRIWKAFGKQINPLFAGIKIRSEESAVLANLRDALLPKLISGEIRIPDVERILRTAS